MPMRNWTQECAKTFWVCTDWLFRTKHWTHQTSRMTFGVLRGTSCSLWNWFLNRQGCWHTSFSEIGHPKNQCGTSQHLGAPGIGFDSNWWHDSVLGWQSVSSSAPGNHWGIVTEFPCWARVFISGWMKPSLIGCPRMFRDTESCHKAGCDQVEHELLTTFDCFWRFLSMLQSLKVHFVGLSGAHQSSLSRSDMLKLIFLNQFWRLWTS